MKAQLNSFSIDSKIILLVKSILLLLVCLTRQVHSHCVVSSNEVILNGLKANRSNVLLHKRYPAIKCRSLRLKLNCHIILANEEEDPFVVLNGKILFSKEGVSQLHCLCQNKTLKYDYCSTTWQVQVGSKIRILSFEQSANFEVTCLTNFTKEKNVTLLLDGKKVMTSTNVFDEEFVFDVRSLINSSVELLQSKVITCQMQNHWGRDEKSFVLNIKYNPKAKHIAINQHFGHVLFVDVNTNVTCVCEFGNPKPKRITFIVPDEHKMLFSILQNRMIPKNGGNYSITCRVELEDGIVINKDVQLNVASKVEKMYGNHVVLMTSSSVGSVLFIILIILTIFCFYKNHRRLTRSKELQAKLPKATKIVTSNRLNKDELECQVILSNDVHENMVVSDSPSDVFNRWKFHNNFQHTLDVKKEKLDHPRCNRSNSV